jgi:hypothetical protein
VVRKSAAAILLAGALLATVGCGHRIVAYRFRAPLVGSVNATSPLTDPAAVADRDHSVREAASAEERTLSPPPIRLSIPSEALRTTGASGDELAAKLRDLVGNRDETSSHVQFALTAIASLGARLDPRLRGADDGPALRDLAAERGALADGESATSPPELGDLLLFDNVTADHPASLVAVVVSTDSRGVVEFVYLGRGVVRRGYLSRAHPTDKRDADGRALNTFIRHSDGTDPQGTRYLAGELHAATIHLARLLH